MEQPQGHKSTSLSLRSATGADAKRLFDWRNDAVTRLNFRNSEPVSWEDHICWLSASLKRQDRELLVAELGNDPVGTVRLDYLAAGCEMSWTVAPKYRCRGIGQEMVRLAIGYARASTLVAEVKPENASSTRIVQHLGFTNTGSRNGLVKWQYSK